MMPGLFYIIFLKLRQWFKLDGLGGRQSVYFLSQTIKETGLKKKQNIDIEKEEYRKNFYVFRKLSFINNRLREIEREMGRFLYIHLGLATDLQLSGLRCLDGGSLSYSSIYGYDFLLHDLTSVSSKALIVAQNLRYIIYGTYLSISNAYGTI